MNTTADLKVRLTMIKDLHEKLLGEYKQRIQRATEAKRLLDHLATTEKEINAVDGAIEDTKRQLESLGETVE